MDTPTPTKRPFFWTRLTVALVAAFAALVPAALAQSVDDYIAGLQLIGGVPSGTPWQGLGSYQVANPTPYQLLANTRNQSRLARAADSLPAGDPVRDAIGRLPVQDAPMAFDRLSGVHYANFQTLMQERDAAFGYGLMNRQAASVIRLGYRENPIVPSITPAPPPPEYCDPCADFGASGLANPSLILPNLVVNELWAQFEADRHRIGSDGNGPHSRLTGSGVALGHQFATSKGWLGGIAFRYGDKTMKTKSLQSKSTLDSYSVALYAGKLVNNRYGNFRASLGTSYSRHQIKSTRKVNFTGFSESLRARHHADSWQVFAEAAQSFYAGMAVLEPFLGVNWSHLRTAAFNERHGSAALRHKTEDLDSLTSLLGMRAYMPLGERFGIEAMAGWSHLFGRRRPDAELVFRTGGDPFTVLGTARDRDALVVSASVDMVVYPSWTMKVGYTGTVGDRGNSHAGHVRVTHGF